MNVKLENGKIAMLIMSCDKFSDLWLGHVKLLEQYWPDRNMQTYIVTDKNHEQVFDNVSIISAGDDVEWSERLKITLKKIDAEYIFITLDDYFLVKPVSNKAINGILDVMQKHRIDYVRIFKQPRRATRERIPELNGFYWIDTSLTYSVNLYPGVWKKELLLNATAKSLNAWKFEVSLARTAQQYNAKCAVDLNKDFVILDVVRKGKLLHKAAHYFKYHPEIYCGTRAINSWRYEIALEIRTLGARYAPKCIVDFARNFMIKRGHHYYSQDAENW